jgi:hypothetical protein
VSFLSRREIAASRDNVRFLIGVLATNTSAATTFPVRQAFSIATEQRFETPRPSDRISEVGNDVWRVASLSDTA